MIAEVCVDVAHSNVDKAYDYKCEEPPVIGGRVTIPFGNRNVQGIVLALKEQTDAENLKYIGAVLDKSPVITVQQLQLAGMMRKRYGCALSGALRLMLPAGLKRAGAKTTKIVRANVPLAQLEDEMQRCFSKEGVVKYPRVLEILRGVAQGDLLLSKCSSSAVKQLKTRGVVQVISEEVWRSPYASLPKSAKDIILNDEQQNAVRRIVSSVAQNKPHTILLHGVTGSGKTQVYIEAVREVIRSGKNAMVLVPEIALAPQLFSQFEGNFPGMVAMFHSSLSDGERFDEWRRVLGGSARIVMGARSALFAPLENVGLIILDEEHESSYKAENFPPYHAHDVARMICKISGGTVVLASATPLLEDYAKAELGIYERVPLNNRVRGLSLPSITVADMRKEFMRGNPTALSAVLQDEIAGCLARSEQALLFLNRRGYSGSATCMSCGNVIMCERCDVPMKYHKNSDTLKCHYCGFERKFDRKCPECGDRFIKLTGVGTQQLQTQLADIFPTARLLRMDFDTTRAKGAHENIYSEFASGGADILLGTQMIARGFDFERVTLAAVINADTMLSAGDFRANERMFSFIEQVGGRAGRSSAGRVVVQTYSPDHFVMNYAKSHDYSGFFESEMALRRSLLLPPFAKLYRFLIIDSKKERAERVMNAMENELGGILLPYLNDIILHVGKPAPVERLQDTFRYHIIVKVTHNKHTLALRGEMLSLATKYASKGVSLDIDPGEVS